MAALLIRAWNYPLQLALSPLVDVLAAGSKAATGRLLGFLTRWTGRV